MVFDHSGNLVGNIKNSLHTHCMYIAYIRTCLRCVRVFVKDCTIINMHEQKRVHLETGLLPTLTLDDLYNLEIFH